MNIYNSAQKMPSELKAHLYQKLSELESLLPKGSSLAVQLEDPDLASGNGKSKRTRKRKSLSKNKKKKTLTVETNPALSLKKVRFKLTTQFGEIDSLGESNDIFSAVTIAQEDLKAKMEFVQRDLMDSKERELEIETAYRSKYLH